MAASQRSSYNSCLLYIVIRQKTINHSAYSCTYVLYSLYEAETIEKTSRYWWQAVVTL